MALQQTASKGERPSDDPQELSRIEALYDCAARAVEQARSVHPLITPSQRRGAAVEARRLIARIRRDIRGTEREGALELVPLHRAAIEATRLVRARVGIDGRTPADAKTFASVRALAATLMRDPVQSSDESLSLSFLALAIDAIADILFHYDQCKAAGFAVRLDYRDGAELTLVPEDAAPDAFERVAAVDVRTLPKAGKRMLQSTE